MTLHLHDLASATHGDSVAMAFHIDGYRVGVWSGDTGALRLVIRDPIYSIGGGRLAISSIGDAVSTSNYDTGMAMYDAIAGTEIWTRLNFRATFGLRFSLGDTYVMMTRGTGGDHDKGLAVDAREGADITAFGICDYLEVLPNSGLWLQWIKSKEAVLRNAAGARVGSVAISRGYSRGRAASSSTVVALSDPGVGVRGLSAVDASEIWRVNLPAGVYANTIAFTERDELFACWAFDSQPSGYGNRMLLIQERDGRVVQNVETHSIQVAGFCRRGSLFVDFQGRAYDIHSHNLVFEFESPND